MLNLTSVALKGNDDDHNICSETGVFVTHSLRKTCAKKNSFNMLLYNSTTKLFTMWLVFLLCHHQQCLASQDKAVTVTAKNTSMKAFQTPPAAYECNSQNFRFDCSEMDKLYNCTVITGYLSIAHFRHTLEECHLKHTEFVNLREITDFFILHHLGNTTSIKNLFPNLTVIRGRKLLRNYALFITSVDVLEKIEFKSLIAIQRGNVIVDSCPKLCQTEKINWTRLTLNKGKNNIFLDGDAECPIKATCTGCKTDACWSNNVCQKFDSDSVISPQQDISECHEQCLGGCYNNTARGCVVCKNYTDHGTCVEECPKDSYTCSIYLRCYTRDECVNKKGLLILNDTCIDMCPSGYQTNLTSQECEPCDRSNKNCINVCGKALASDVIFIPDISEAEKFKNCEVIEGSMVIDIYEPFDPEELKVLLKDIREITGFLKINRSPFLTSLDFLENLEKIHGHILEDELYSLIIYHNVRLSELWNVKPGFEILRGGMYIQANNKLCNRRIKVFRESIRHDKSLDSIQKSDQEILCSPAKLNLRVKVIDHRSIQLLWPFAETSVEVEIIYKPVHNNEQLTEESEIDTDVCNRINWRRELKFARELEGDKMSQYIYTIKNLEPGTKYAILVKTFNGDDDSQAARSEIQYTTTTVDYPKPPKLALKGKAFDRLEIEFSEGEDNSFGRNVVDYYILDVYDIPEDKDSLDMRDYCDEPIMDFKEFAQEDYDECCSRREAERNDKNFLAQLRQEFSCSLDRKEFCNQNKNNYGSQPPVTSKRFEAKETSFTITGLERFHLYVLQLQACNRAGCGSFSMLSARTDYSPDADQVHDFVFCKTEGTNEYRVKFKEPSAQNGYITSYALHFRNHNFSENSNKTELYHLVCITRLEHERSNYVFAENISDTFNQAALRVYSLGHNTFVEWVNVTSCSERRMGLPSLQYIFTAIILVSSCIISYFCYRGRYWRRIPELARAFMPVNPGWRFIRPRQFIHQDRQNLVPGVEVSRFLAHRDDNAAEYHELQQRLYEERQREVLDADEPDDADDAL